METKTMTISELAAQVSAQFERKERDNGTKFWARKSDAQDWIQDLCREAHGDMLPDDWRYSFIIDALDTLADYPAGTEDQAQDAIAEIEPDVYTSDLTEWLNSRNDRVEYLTEAIANYGGTLDGFQALAAAQQAERQEVAYLVLASLQARIEELEA